MVMSGHSEFKFQVYFYISGLQIENNKRKRAYIIVVKSNIDWYINNQIIFQELFFISSISSELCKYNALHAIAFSPNSHVVKHQCLLSHK